ncbi:MAG TPA: VanZ family protein [Burkholderiales bacterium]|jgi:VanZ family protein
MKLRRAWLGLGWVGVVGVVILSLVPLPPMAGAEHGDKFGHATTYGLLMWWFAQAWLRSDSRARTAVGLLALGVALEFAQGWTGFRDFSVADMIADALGIALGWLLAPPRMPNVLQRASACLS